MTPAGGASVVVCCRDSAPRLLPTLDHLARQRDVRDWEVVLVDNGSTDGTVALAERHWRRLGDPAPLRVVAEPRAGLAFARDTGIRAARRECVVLCDDDNWLAPDYLARAAALLDAMPRVGVLGGRADLAAEGPVPTWFAEAAHDYAVGEQLPRTGDATRRRFVWGAGMALRRSVYLCARGAGARPLLPDRTGPRLSSGGDTEICMWFMLAGYRLWYDADLHFRHHVPAARLTPEYRDRLRREDGSVALLKRYLLVVEALDGTSPARRVLALARGAAKVLAGRVPLGWVLQAHGLRRGGDAMLAEIRAMARAARDACAALPRG